MDALSALRERVDLLEEKFQRFEDSFKVDPSRYFSSVHLSRVEAVLVSALSNGALWSSDRLLARLDTFSAHGDTTHSEDFLRVLIHRIRGKFGALDPPIVIQTVWGQGYQLAPDSVPLLAERRVT